MSYNWLATVAFVITLVVVSKAVGFLIFKIPALQNTRQMNRDVDRGKLSRKRFREAVKKNNKVGLITNVIFYVTILPFCLSFETAPFWRYLVEILAVNQKGKKATIQYTTGETEELELGEIIRDGHMSLITK